MSFSPALEGKGRRTWTLNRLTGNQLNMLAEGDVIRLTGSGSIFGIVSNGVEREVTLYNDTGSAFSLLHASTSSNIGNRFDLPGSTTFSLQSKSSVTLKWCSLTRDWKFLGKKLVMAPSYVFTESLGTVNMNQASFGAYGYLAPGDYSFFYYKASVDNPEVNGVPWLTSTSHPVLRTEIAKLSFDSVTENFGVGLPVATAGIHVDKDTGTTVPLTSSHYVSVNTFTLLNTPYSFSVSASTPYLGKVIQNTPSINYSGSGYTADGNTLMYKIWSYSAGSFVVVSSDSPSVTDDYSSNPYYVDVTWSDDPGTQFVDGYRIFRDMNGDGFASYQDIGTGSSFVDANSGWNYATYADPTPQWPDYIANGSYSSAQFQIAHKGTTPAATDVYSTYAFYNFSDAGDGKPYLRYFSWTNYEALDVKIIDPVQGNGIIVSYPSTSFLSDTSTAWDQDTVQSPTTYGFLSNGSDLNFNIDTYSADNINGTTIYSSTSYQTVITDPNNGQYHYYDIYIYGSNSYTKTVMVGGIMAISKIEDDFFRLDQFLSGDSGVITPTSYVYPAFYFRTNNGASADTGYIQAGVDDGSKTRIKWLDALGGTLGILQTDASGNFHFGRETSNYISIGASGFNNRYASYIITDESTVSVNNVQSEGNLRHQGSNRLTWKAEGVHVTGGLQVAYGGIGGTYTIQTTDMFVNCVGSSSFAITLPTAVGRTGKVYILKQSGTGTITINTTSSQTIDGNASGVLTMTQYQSYTVISDSLNWIIV